MVPLKQSYFMNMAMSCRVPLKREATSLSRSEPLRLEALPVTYAGGLRDDCTVLHSFLFMARRGQGLNYMELHPMWFFNYSSTFFSPCPSNQ